MTSASPDVLLQPDQGHYNLFGRKQLHELADRLNSGRQSNLRSHIAYKENPSDPDNVYSSDFFENISDAFIDAQIASGATEFTMNPYSTGNYIQHLLTLRTEEGRQWALRLLQLDSVDGFRKFRGSLKTAVKDGDASAAVVKAISAALEPIPFAQTDESKLAMAKIMIGSMLDEAYVVAKMVRDLQVLSKNGESAYWEITKSYFAKKIAKRLREIYVASKAASTDPVKKARTGYLSIEVDPRWEVPGFAEARGTTPEAGMIAEARELARMPELGDMAEQVLVKAPSTPAGIATVSEVDANFNVTLSFADADGTAAINAFESRLTKREHTRQMHPYILRISPFVSRNAVYFDEFWQPFLEPAASQPRAADGHAMTIANMHAAFQAMHARGYSAEAIWSSLGVKVAGDPGWLYAHLIHGIAILNGPPDTAASFEQATMTLGRFLKGGDVGLQELLTHYFTLVSQGLIPSAKGKFDSQISPKEQADLAIAKWREIIDRRVDNARVDQLFARLQELETKAGKKRPATRQALADIQRVVQAQEKSGAEQGNATRELAALRTKHMVTGEYLTERDVMRIVLKYEGEEKFVGPFQGAIDMLDAVINLRRAEVESGYAPAGEEVRKAAADLFARESFSIGVRLSGSEVGDAVLIAADQTGFRGISPPAFRWTDRVAADTSFSLETPLRERIDTLVREGGARATAYADKIVETLANQIIRTVKNLKLTEEQQRNFKYAVISAPGPLNAQQGDEKARGVVGTPVNAPNLPGFKDREVARQVKILVDKALKTDITVEVMHNVDVELLDETSQFGTIPGAQNCCLLHLGPGDNAAFKRDGQIFTAGGELQQIGHNLIKLTLHDQTTRWVWKGDASRGAYPDLATVRDEYGAESAVTFESEFSLASLQAQLLAEGWHSIAQLNEDAMGRRGNDQAVRAIRFINWHATEVGRAVAELLNHYMFRAEDVQRIIPQHTVLTSEVARQIGDGVKILHLESAGLTINDSYIEDIIRSGGHSEDLWLVMLKASLRKVLESMNLNDEHRSDRSRLVADVVNGIQRSKLTVEHQFSAAADRLTYHQDMQRAQAIAARTEIARYEVLMAIDQAQSGHLGGSLSVLPILQTLYDGILRHDSQNPDWEFRDRLVLSGGHKAPGLYATFLDAGLMHRQNLRRLRQDVDGPAQGHATIGTTPGVDASTGALGDGIAEALGMAIGAHLDGIDSHIFTVIGDGEFEKGTIYEVGTTAVQHGLDNLTVILDYNQFQQTERSDNLSSLRWDENDPDAQQSIHAFWKNLGWNVLSVDGENDALRYDDVRYAFELRHAFQQAKNTKNERPTIVLVRSMKGRGVPIIENTFRSGSTDYHGKPLPKDAHQAAVRQIAGRLKVQSDDSVGFDEVVRRMDQKTAELAAQNKPERLSSAEVESIAKNNRVFKSAARDERSYTGKPILRPFYAPGDKVSTRAAAANYWVWAASQNGPVVSAHGTDAVLQDSTRLVFVDPSELEDSTGILEAGKRLGKFSTQNRRGREIKIGIKEKTGFGIAKGLYAMGFIPVIGTFARFGEQGVDVVNHALRNQQAMALHLTHHGSAGPDGPSQWTQNTPCIYMGMAGLGGRLMNVYAGSDGNTAIAMAEMALADVAAGRPAYLELHRDAVPVLPALDHKTGGYDAHESGFIVRHRPAGKTQVVLVAIGGIVHNVLKAKDELARKGVQAAVIEVTSPTLIGSPTGQFRDEFQDDTPIVAIQDASPEELYNPLETMLGGALGQPEPYSRGIDESRLGSAPTREQHKASRLLPDQIADDVQRILNRDIPDGVLWRGYRAPDPTFDGWKIQLDSALYALDALARVPAIGARTALPLITLLMRPRSHERRPAVRVEAMRQLAWLITNNRLNTRDQSWSGTTQRQDAITAIARHTEPEIEPFEDNRQAAEQVLIGLDLADHIHSAVQLRKEVAAKYGNAPFAIGGLIGGTHIGPWGVTNEEYETETRTAPPRINWPQDLRQRHEQNPIPGYDPKKSWADQSEEFKQSPVVRKLADRLAGDFAMGVVTTVLKMGLTPGQIREHFKLVMISVAGPVDAELGMFGAPDRSPNTPFDHYPLATTVQFIINRELNERLKLPINVMCFVDNDAAMGRDGEMGPGGTLDGIQNGMVFINGSGNNGQIIQNGKPWSAGGEILELGHNIIGHRHPGSIRNRLLLGNAFEWDYIGHESRGRIKAPKFSDLDLESRPVVRFEDLFKGDTLKQLIRQAGEKGDLEKGESDKGIPIWEDSEGLVRVAQSGGVNAWSAVDFIVGQGHEMGRAYAAMLAHYINHKEPSKRLKLDNFRFVLISGVSETFARGLSRRTAIEVLPSIDKSTWDGEDDLWLSAIKQGVYDGLTAAGVAPDVATPVAYGFVRSKMDATREIAGAAKKLRELVARIKAVKAEPERRRREAEARAETYKHVRNQVARALERQPVIEELHRLSRIYLQLQSRLLSDAMLVEVNLADLERTLEQDAGSYVRLGSRGDFELANADPSAEISDLQADLLKLQLQLDQYWFPWLAGQWMVLDCFGPDNPGQDVLEDMALADRPVFYGVTGVWETEQYTIPPTADALDLTPEIIPATGRTPLQKLVRSNDYLLVISRSGLVSIWPRKDWHGPQKMRYSVDADVQARLRRAGGWRGPIVPRTSAPVPDVVKDETWASGDPLLGKALQNLAAAGYGTRAAKFDPDSYLRGETPITQRGAGIVEEHHEGFAEHTLLTMDQGVAAMRRGQPTDDSTPVELVFESINSELALDRLWPSDRAEEWTVVGRVGTKNAGMDVLRDLAEMDGSVFYNLRRSAWRAEPVEPPIASAKVLLGREAPTELRDLSDAIRSKRFYLMISRFGLVAIIPEKEWQAGSAGQPWRILNDRIQTMLREADIQLVRQAEVKQSNLPATEPQRLNLSTTGADRAI